MAPMGPACEKHNRLEWTIRSDSQGHELQGPLRTAILQQGVKEVERLVQAGAPLAAEYELEESAGFGTALDLAMQCKRFRLALQWLQLEQAEAEELARASKRAVAWAARDGKLEILQELMRLGADIGQRDHFGRSALLLATMHGHAECAHILVGAGALDKEDQKGASEVSQLMDNWKSKPAALVDDGQIAQARVAQTARWANSSHQRMPWPLPRSGDEDEGCEQRMPLERAILYESRKDVEQLLREGAQVLGDFDLGSAGTGNALDLAMLKKRFQLALQLLTESEGNKLARTSTRALAWAARDGRELILKELLRYEADAGQRDEQGRSALLLATQRGHGQCAQALLEAGAWEGEDAREEVRQRAAQWRLQLPVAIELQGE